MPDTKFKLILQKSDIMGWDVWLSDGVQEATINACFEYDLWSLALPVHLLLLGTSDSWCSWMQEPGEYRWLFSRQDEKLTIHVLWFKQYLSHLDNNRGEAVVRMECDLLAFAKRLFQQLNQLSYHRDPSASLPQSILKLQESNLKLRDAIKAYEQAKCEQPSVAFKRGKRK